MARKPEVVQRARVRGVVPEMERGSVAEDRPPRSVSTSAASPRASQRSPLADGRVICVDEFGPLNL